MHRLVSRLRAKSHCEAFDHEMAFATLSCHMTTHSPCPLANELKKIGIERPHSDHPLDSWPEKKGPGDCLFFVFKLNQRRKILPIPNIEGRAGFHSHLKLGWSRISEGLGLAPNERFTVQIYLVHKQPTFL